MQRTTGNSDRIREFAGRNYVERARADGKLQFSIRAGDVVRELKLHHRTPQVIHALKSKEFLQANGLKLISVVAPASAPSGQSTRVVMTFAFQAPRDGPSAASLERPASAFSQLRDLAGTARSVYEKLGGPEKALEDERSGWQPA
jgi:hypothetical protein